MKTFTETKLIAFVPTCGSTLKLWYADTRYFKNKVVDLDSPEFCDEIERRDHTYHVTFESDCLSDCFDTTCYSFDTAYTLFKEIIKYHDFKEVVICDDFETYNPYKEWEEAPMTQEEEYEEACMAEAYGNPLLMRRYERKYGIEKEYSPSNPWDAPGMSIHDFI